MTFFIYFNDGIQGFLSQGTLAENPDGLYQVETIIPELEETFEEFCQVYLAVFEGPTLQSSEAVCYFRLIRRGTFLIISSANLCQMQRREVTRRAQPRHACQ